MTGFSSPRGSGDLDDHWRDVGAFIRDQRRLAELSLRKLAETAGVSNPYLSQIERGLRRPSAEILRQIAQALHLSAETLYVRAGILDESPVETDVVDALRRDPFLDDDQKRALLHIYRSFRDAGAAGSGESARAAGSGESARAAGRGAGDRAVTVAADPGGDGDPGRGGGGEGVGPDVGGAEGPR